MVTSDARTEFQKIYEELYNVELSDIEAEEVARNILNLMAVLVTKDGETENER